MSTVRLDDFVDNTLGVESVVPETIRMDDAAMSQRIPVDTDEMNLLDLISIPDSLKDEWKGRGKIGFVEHAQGVSLGKFAPFVGTGIEAKQNLDVLNAMHRLQDDEYGDNKLQRNKDVQLAQTYLLGLAEEQIRGYSFGGDVARGVAELPALGMELLMTFGIGTAAKTSVAKGTTVALKGVSSKFLRRALAHSVGFAAGAAVETAAQIPTRVAKGAFEKEIGRNLVLTDKGLQISEKAVSKPFQSFMEATADVYIEIATERAGEAFLGPLISKGTDKALGIFPKKMKDALTKAYIHMHGRAGVNKLFTRAGYNGFITELGEERLGDLVRAITGVGFGPDDGNVFDRIWDSIPSGYELGVEAAVLAFPGAIKYSSSKMIDQIRKQVDPKVEAAKPQPKTLSQAEVINIIEKEAEQTPGQKAKVKEKELNLEEVQEKQARQKVQEDKLSKEELRQLAVEQVKDEQIKGRIKKLDADKKGVEREIVQLSKERKQINKSKTLTPEQKSKKILDVDVKIHNKRKSLDSLEVQVADMLTEASEQVNLEKEKLEVRGDTLTKIAREGIKNSIKAMKKGVKLGQAKVTEVQNQALQVLLNSELDAADKGKFLKTIKNIKTEAQLEAAIPRIEARIEKLEEKATRRNLIKGIQKKAKAKVSADYREQIDSLLEIYDLKARSQKTKDKRESRMAFLARERQDGNLDMLPADFFANLGTNTLDEMSTEELQGLHDQIAILAHVGATKQRLISEKSQKDLDEQARESAESIYDKTNSSPKQGDSERWQPVSGKRGIALIFDKIDAFFAIHRKVEFISHTLGVAKEIFEKIQSGINKELTTAEVAYGKLQKSFQRFESNLSDMMHKPIQLPGVGVELTWEQMIGVALNSGNTGNLNRLLKGNEFTQEEIQIIVDKVDSNPEAKAFVSEVHELLDSLFPEVSAVTEKLYGVRPPKVEGRYFPIIEDFKTSEQAQARQAAEDLFQQIFKTTYMNRSFTYRRTGGTAPVNLNVFEVLLNHLDGVIHYTSLAAEVRDVQKLIKHPLFHKAVSDTMGENIYNQFPTWLRSVANPSGMRAGNIVQKMAQGLRHNSTASLLAHRVSVSLLQGGSYFQTIFKIGTKYAAIGLKDYHKNRKAATEFVYSRSAIMRNRRNTFDREVKDFLKSKRVSHLASSGKNWNEVMFGWITGIDMITTMPSWLGAYQQGLDLNDNNEALAIQHADHVVRTTQPTGSVENLAEVMKGDQWQKMWTMFMSHFSNTHNLLVSAMDQLKYSKAHPLRKTGNYARALFWLWVAPATLSSIIRSGGDVDDWKKHLKELALYPFAGILLVRDIMNMLLKGFDFGAPPALSGLVEAGRAVKSKSPQKKLRHGIKAVGILTGKIPTQYADTLDGAIDLYNDETDDPRRLFMSEWALKPSKTKSKKRRTRRR